MISSSCAALNKLIDLTDVCNWSYGTGQQLYHYPSLGGVCTRFALTAFEGTTQGQYWSLEQRGPTSTYGVPKYVNASDNQHRKLSGNCSAGMWQLNTSRETNHVSLRVTSQYL